MVGLIAMLLAGVASAKGNAITGQIVDRNGQPVPRAVVSLKPGNVELVTDRDGHFTIDYLRAETGERVKLGKKTEYTLEVWKLGFHVFSEAVPYRRGALVVDTVTMLED